MHPTCYGYDNLSRVTLVNAPGSDPDVSYAYDNLGRRSSLTRGPFETPPAAAPQDEAAPSQATPSTRCRGLRPWPRMRREAPTT